MMNRRSNLNEADQALCRGALYEALSLGFLPPTHETLHRLVSREQNDTLVEIAAAVDEDLPSGVGESNLALRVRHLRELFERQNLEAIQASYRRLFGHVAHSTVPLYETEYGEETLFQQPQQLADISGFLNAFGLVMAVSQHERVDHVSCECEFLCFLSCKEAYALERGDSHTVEETRKAQRLFLKDHLGRFVPSLANLLRRADGDGFYGTLGELCEGFVRGQCRRYGMTPGPVSLRLRPTEMYDEPVTCGAGDEVIRSMSCGCLPSKEP